MKSNKFYTVDEVLLLMEHYCAYQDRCHKEIEQKLIDYKMIPAAQEKIILHLINQNYLNEERFAKNYARGKFNSKHWGRIKIKAALKQRNISDYNINIAFKEIDIDEYYTVLSIEMEKKLGVLKERDEWKRKKKVIDYLLQKGFEYHLIEQCWNDLEHNT
ncbi:MAG: RecX family transcriptional regulator [Bacteroidetes bacterium]|jgi:regulatory protein|nr:RecX family transcriptional regulator [Bacteroidota bacterium]